MLFSGKIPSLSCYEVDCEILGTLFATICDNLPLFATIRLYSRLFATIRIIRTIRYSGLLAVRYSRLFAIRYSGFPDTHFSAKKHIRLSGQKVFLKVISSVLTAAKA